MTPTAEREHATEPGAAHLEVSREQRLLEWGSHLLMLIVFAGLWLPSGDSNKPLLVLLVAWGVGAVCNRLDIARPAVLLTMDGVRVKRLRTRTEPWSRIQEVEVLRNLGWRRIALTIRLDGEKDTVVLPMPIAFRRVNAERFDQDLRTVEQWWRHHSPFAEHEGQAG